VSFRTQCGAHRCDDEESCFEPQRSSPMKARVPFPTAYSIANIAAAVVAAIRLVPHARCVMCGMPGSHSAFAPVTQTANSSCDNCRNLRLVRPPHLHAREALRSAASALGSVGAFLVLSASAAELQTRFWSEKWCGFSIDVHGIVTQHAPY